MEAKLVQGPTRTMRYTPSGNVSRNTVITIGTPAWPHAVSMDGEING